MCGARNENNFAEQIDIPLGKSLFLYVYYEKM